MNATIAEIMNSRKVSNGHATFELNSAVSAEEGERLAGWIEAANPTTYLEVGLAYGVSALYAGSTLKRLGKPYSHIVIDPCQSEVWSDVGIHNLKQEGLWDRVRFLAEGSETALPKLMMEGTRLQAAFIDGWHTFDHALIDFFYINRMMDVGGIVVFDDANWPAITKLIDYVLKYPAYEFVGGSSVNVVRSVGRDVLRGSIPRLMPSMVAVRKVAEDKRSWDWYSAF